MKCLSGIIEKILNVMLIYVGLGIFFLLFVLNLEKNLVDLISLKSIGQYLHAYIYDKRHSLETGGQMTVRMDD